MADNPHADEVAARTAELLELGDPDELIRHIDRLADVGAWRGLADLRAGCTAAAERGRQLWPVRSYAEYRLALDAPPPEAGAVLEDRAGWLALGPLTEVAACHHTFAELAPHVGDPMQRAVLAQERVCRGEDVGDHPLAGPSPLDLPGALRPWESYPLADYESHDASFPGPVWQPGTWAELGPAGDRLDDPDTVDALRALVEPWVASGTGRLEVTTVEGPAEAAISALGPTRARLTELKPMEAVGWLGWVGASSGANGRRRGLAAGRANTWWLLAALADTEVDDVALLDTFVARARWVRFDVGEPELGWQLRLAVEDPEAGLAWAVVAQDF